MQSATATTFGLHVSDVTGQRTFRATSVSTESTVGEFVQSLLAKLGLATTDAQGYPLAYRARLNREGRHLHGSELIGDALEHDDHITLQPSIDAGSSPQRHTEGTGILCGLCELGFADSNTAPTV